MAEFTGERVIPGQVDPDLLNEHLARYTFAARLARGKRVLDAGCGAGYGSAELAKCALAVTAADISAEAVRYARENYRLPNLQFVQASCVALPCRDASVDLVVAFEVIEHLNAWREFLLEVRRVLSLAGQFVVSTPNKLYYRESRAQAGPNPFHEHEFEYAEFRAALAEVFPNIAMFLENHAEAMVFQPVEGGSSSEVRIDAADPKPAEAHFFLAVCAPRPQAGTPTFVYVPTTANVLRDRERHIELLEGELLKKNEWLDEAKRDLAELNEAHQSLVEMLEQRNEWAMGLNRSLEAAGARIAALQDEAARDHEAFESRVSDLERENREKTEWALETERRLGGEVEEKSQELVKCVELLHEAERTVEERTKWALGLEAGVARLEQQIALVNASRWVRFGRRMGVGPVFPAG